MRSYNIPATSGLPGLDAAIAMLERNGYRVHRNTVRWGYTVADTRAGGRTRDGVTSLGVIEMAAAALQDAETSRP